MKSEKVSGYFIRKMAKDVVVDDIILIYTRTLVVDKVNEISTREGTSIEIVSTNQESLCVRPSAYFNCLQKEDPSILFNINKKLAILKKDKKFSSVEISGQAFPKVFGHMLIPKDLDCPTVTWEKDGRPHLWKLMEVLDDYEFWNDFAYHKKVLWKDNDIIASSKNPWRYSCTSNRLLAKDGTLVLDKVSFCVDKFIWR
jgi:hypothetical protein